MKKEKLNKVKEIIKSKEGITLVGVITLLLVITIINVAVKDTHAYYNSVTDPVQIFNGKVGNFKPRIDIFYIKENNVQPKYTNSNINTVYLTPGNNNSNLDQVCITETDDINTCNGKWQNITENNQYSYTFPDGTEGAKVIFGFVKDRYGNKSLSISDIITYDVTPPTVSYSVPGGTYNTNQTVTVTPSDAVSGVGLWMVHAYKNSVFDEVQSSWDLTGWPSYNVTLTEGYWTVYSRVYDNTSNIIVQEPNNGDNWFYQNYTIDTTPPTVWYSLSEGTYTGTQTLTIIPSDNLTGVGYWVVHVYKDNVFDSTQSIELTGQPSYTVTLTEGSSWTVYASIYDNAGNLITQTPNNGAGWYYQNYTINKPGKSGQDLINDRYNNAALQDDPVDGLYRYYGTKDQVTNNYICLGPTFEDTCQDGNDMYRIIGITEDGRIKVIKAKSIGTIMLNDTYGAPRKWNETNAYTHLNGDFYNSVNTRIKGLIEYHTWNMEKYSGSNNWPSENPTSDSISEGTVQNFIGLMYATDYPNAGPNTKKDLTNWLYIQNGWNNISETYEFTMTRYGLNSTGYYSVWRVDDGYIGKTPANATAPLRPVFYLIPNIKLTGTGISSDPFRIVN